MIIGNNTSQNVYGSVGHLPPKSLLMTLEDKGPPESPTLGLVDWANGLVIPPIDGVLTPEMVGGATAVLRGEVSKLLESNPPLRTCRKS